MKVKSEAKEIGKKKDITKNSKYRRAKKETTTKT